MTFQGKDNMKEYLIKREILLELSKHPRIMLWNNPTAVAKPRASGRYIRFGVPGAADLLGVIGVVIGTTFPPPDQPLGIALAIETKTNTGELSPKQVNWKSAFSAHGGIYILARSVENAQNEITIALRERGIEWEWKYPDL